MQNKRPFAPPTDESANFWQKYNLQTALEKNDLTSFAEILDANWHLKRTLAKGVTSSVIDDIYEKALQHGASGGKLLGAGGGGFLLFYCEAERQDELRQSLTLEEFPFHFEHDGTSIAYIGDKY